MISLAGRDIIHSWGKFVFTGLGLGLLIGVTLTMAGVYRGMLDDAKALLDNSGAELWIVQKNTLGPYAEPSSVYDDLWRTISVTPGVSRAANVTYLTMQVHQEDRDIRAMISGIVPGGAGTPGWPPYLISGRHIANSHYEAVVDISSGLELGQNFRIRRDYFTVVGLTRRMVSSNGDPMIFIPLKDAQNAQFIKDNDAIWQQRRRNTVETTLNYPGNYSISEEINESQSSNHFVNAILVQIKSDFNPEKVAEAIRRWKNLTVYTRSDMESIVIGKLIATSSKQIGMFLIILAVVSASIVAFIIYTLTIGKIREIAVLKLIGTRNRTIASMIIQQSLVLGMIGFIVGKISATFAAPYFPKHILLEPLDSVIGIFALLAICVLSSTIAIYAALKIDPAEAIGG